MPLPYSLPQQNPPVSLLVPAADAAGRTSGYVTLKHCAKAYIVCHIAQGNAATILLTPLQAQDVSGTASKVLANTVPIWSDLNVASSDALVAQTAAVNYTTDAGLNNKIVIFEIDPAELDLVNGFKTLAVSTGASNVANITSALVIFAGLRFEQATPISVLAN